MTIKTKKPSSEVFAEPQPPKYVPQYIIDAEERAKRMAVRRAAREARDAAKAQS